MLGDSITRNLFWDLVGLFLEEEAGARALSQGSDPDIIYTVRDNVEAPRNFSNFQDQELFAWRLKHFDPSSSSADSSSATEHAAAAALPGSARSSTPVEAPPGRELLFSIRFVYVAHAADFPGRCEHVHHWFFQCPDPLDVIAERILGGEARAGLPPRDLTYINTGMWDWRTGVPVDDYASYLDGALSRALPRLSERGGRLVWRHSTAAYPSKFASADECRRSKIRQDARPCSIHTDGLLNYNRRAHSIARRHGFSTVLDPWPITSTRPDLTKDGIHYTHPAGYDIALSGKRVRSNPTSWARDPVGTVPIYRTMNDQFFSAVCER
jgi:hypothetical protein